jgi:superoxide dismutase
MKHLPHIALLVVAAASVQAAPALQPAYLSEATLKGIATERQKASIDKYNKAVARAEKERSKAIKDAQKLTQKNDEGMKKTIQRRQLNTMLPPCEREPETPRDPRNLIIRY